MSTQPTAEVALRMFIDADTSAVFSYRIPAHLQADLQPGQLVWVPLRSQVVQGVVLSIHSIHSIHAAEQDAGSHTALSSGKPLVLREIVARVEPAVSMPPAGLHLARWVAETYRTSLYEALSLLLPPGITQKAVPTWKATPEGLAVSLGTLPERERAVLYYLRVHGEMTEQELQRELSGSVLRSAYKSLQERGLLVQGRAISVPRARPKTEQVARLLVPPADMDAALATLQRAPKQRDVLTWLAAHSQEQVPISAVYAATGTRQPVLQALEHKGLLALETREVRRDPLSTTTIPPDNPPPLTPGQRHVWEPIVAALEAVTTADNAPVQATARVFLLHGVTGSGKTEIYLRAAARIMRLGRQVMVVVPEIALTAQLVRRFASRFPGQIAVLHSHLSMGERYDEWRRLRSGAARLVIGSRSVVFAPLPDLGLIIVDEEHEPTYKHDGSPRYHARDVALHLGTLTNSVVILGSATPAVESYHAAQTGHMTLLTMPERVGALPGTDGLPRSQALPLPHVRLVDMRRELQDGNRSIFSQVLQTALGEALERGEQAILFLNQRGAASFVMCRDCGYVVGCSRCSGSLYVHYEDTAEGDRGPPAAAPTAESRSPVLTCHTCNYRMAVPVCCPQCLSPRIKPFGIGTQRVEETVHALFPAARPIRWDSDSSSGKGAHDRLLEQFLSQEANVLVGTQMIAKGLDLPHVSLVGVIAADTGLYLPDFRSGERAFQLLTQVAGRAGRRTAGARVIIQTYVPDHYALRAAREHDYHTFYTEEIAFRRQMNYPPFGRLVRFVYASSSTAACERATTELAERLCAAAELVQADNWSIIGPAPAFFQRMRGRWRWHVLLRASDPVPILAELGRLSGWLVDVDPVHLL